MNRRRFYKKSDSLDGAHAKKLEFDECFYDQPSMVHDQHKLTEVRKIETTMLPLTQEKTTTIAPMPTHIDFVIPDKFNGEECKNFLSLVLPQDMLKPNTKVLILHI